VVLFPARILWDKGVGEFVAAARKLHERKILAKFVLAGEPDYANPSTVKQEQIAQWVEEGVVEYLGWVKDMPSLLAQSNIVCLPSFYGEGIPKSLIEAAAAARPIVTTDMPGCREIVNHGDNGLLVPPRDARALSRSLVHLIKNPDLRQKMGSRGRVRAVEGFGLDVVIRKTLELYKKGD